MATSKVKIKAMLINSYVNNKYDLYVVYNILE